MVELKKGQIVTLEKARSGEGKNGTYLMVPVSSEKGFDKITVWAANAADLNIDGVNELRVAEIVSVKRSKRQYNEKWYENVDANCVLEVVKTAVFGDESSGQIASDDDDLPFS